MSGEQSKYETPFQESEAFLAILAGDEDYAWEVLHSMRSGELHQLQMHLLMFGKLINEVMRERGEAERALKGAGL